MIKQRVNTSLPVKSFRNPPSTDTIVNKLRSSLLQTGMENYETELQISMKYIDKIIPTCVFSLFLPLPLAERTPTMLQQFRTRVSRLDREINLQGWICSLARGSHQVSSENLCLEAHLSCV